jgi:hypothetical protein
LTLGQQSQNLKQEYSQRKLSTRSKTKTTEIVDNLKVKKGEETGKGGKEDVKEERTQKKGPKAKIERLLNQHMIRTFPEQFQKTSLLKETGLCLLVLVGRLPPLG